MWRRDNEWTVWGGLVIAGGVTLIITTLLIIGTIMIAGLFATTQLIRFSQASNTNLTELASYGVAALSRQPLQSDGRKNILILGLDQLENRGAATVLTDTMLVVSVDFKTGQIVTLPFPRDLWSEQYLSKINSLYYYGQSRGENPTQLPTEVISDMTKLPIHHTVVVSLEQLAALIDVVGGVEVDVPTAFVDETFPRTDVDVTVERDPTKLYEVVSFDAGRQTLTGDRALEYVRSRKSSGETGGDEARTVRQQDVIAALIKKISNSDTFSNPALVARLISYYQDNFAWQLSTGEAAATAYALLPVRNNLQFHSQTLSIFPADPNGVLVHPPLSSYNGQWVYTIRNQTAFEDEIQTKLNFTAASSATAQ